jgi:hypothetical protein
MSAKRFGNDDDVEEFQVRLTIDSRHEKLVIVIVAV